MTKKKWAGYEVERQEKIDSAFRVAQDAQKKTPVEKEESRRKVGSLAKAGTKKRPYGKRVLPPFEGVSQQQSDVIREFVAYEFSGYSKRAAADKVGNYSTIMGTLERYPEALEKARAEATSRCIMQYGQNMHIMRAALSDAGPRAVRTITELMDDRSVAAGTRLKASVELLKMLNVSGKASSGSEEVKLEIAGAIRDARAEVKSDRIIVVDAEEVEVIEDGDDGNCGPDEQAGREYPVAAQA